MSSKKGAKKRSVDNENTSENLSQKRRRTDDQNAEKENQLPNILCKKDEETSSSSRKFSENVTKEQRTKHLNGSLYEDAQLLAGHCNRTNVAEKDFVMVSELEQRSKNRHEKIDTIRKENERLLQEQNEAFIRNEVVAAIREQIRKIIHEVHCMRLEIDKSVQNQFQEIVHKEVRESTQLHETLQFVQLILYFIIFLFICLKTN